MPFSSEFSRHRGGTHVSYVFMSPALAGGFFTTSVTWEALFKLGFFYIYICFGCQCFIRCFAKIFSRSMTCFLILFTLSFTEQFFILMKSNQCFSFMDHRVIYFYLLKCFFISLLTYFILSCSTVYPLIKPRIWNLVRSLSSSFL